MDASRYFTAMHNAMSAQHPRAQLLLTVKLQDTCGNDACLELKQLPGESTSILCYSTMGRRCLNFQLFRKGWQLCHNADGQLVGRFPSSADGLIDETDFRASAGKTGWIWHAPNASCLSCAPLQEPIIRAASPRTPAPVPLLPWRVL